MTGKVTTFDSGAHDQRVGILISYHYVKNIDLTEFLHGIFGANRPRVYLDSGAWSAFTSGVTINLPDYIDYVRRHRDVLWTYCNLDDMRDPEITRRNQRTMEDAGLAPMPTFHVGEPWKYLEGYAAEYDHLAIGRIVPFTTRPKVIIPYLGKCFRVIDGRAKVHGLGVSNTALLRMFPWTTSDSSAWNSGFKFGTINLFDQLSGGFKGFHFREHRSFNQFQELLREHHVSRFDYTGDIPKEKRAEFGALQVVAYLKMTEWIRRRHGNEYTFFFAGTKGDFDYVREGAAAWRET